MKAFFLSFLMFCFVYCNAQKTYVGPASNVGREYGNPKMPLMVSHLAGANKERLKRVSKNSRHSFFGKILCFRRLCRIQSGHTASLRAISFKKFRKKVARNAKKDLYRKTQSDSTYVRKPVVRTTTTPVIIDTTSARPAPVIKADSLIILGAELLLKIRCFRLWRLKKSLVGVCLLVWWVSSSRSVWGLNAETPAEKLTGKISLAVGRIIHKTRI